MLIDDAKTRLALRERHTAEDSVEMPAQRAALERAFSRLLAGGAASAALALADLLAPRDDQRVH